MQKNKIVYTYPTSGFSLIELLVVVLITGILAAVALSQYKKATDRAKFKTIISVMRSIIKAENLYKLEYGDYTLNWENLPFDIPHTQISTNKATLVVPGGRYNLSNQGTFPHVTFGDAQYNVTIYGAFPTNLWLCYPYTKRGQQICKNLGCREEALADQYCYFSPSK